MYTQCTKGQKQFNLEVQKRGLYYQMKLKISRKLIIGSRWDVRIGFVGRMFMNLVLFRTLNILYHVLTFITYFIFYILYFCGLNILSVCLLVYLCVCLIWWLKLV